MSKEPAPPDHGRPGEQIAPCAIKIAANLYSDTQSRRDIHLALLGASRRLRFFALDCSGFGPGPQAVAEGRATGGRGTRNAM